MPRPPAFVLWLATLASGVALGLALGSRNTPLVAQTNTGPVIGSNTQAASAGRKGLDEEALYLELAKSYERFQPVDRTFETVARAVSPSVVHITARKVGERGGGEIGRFEETGSGVIVRPDGGKGLFVLTNNHVVDGATAEDVTILLHDGQVLKPVRFWADVKADVAVLKLDREGLPAAHLGNSDDARIGTWVMALGSPFGLTHSVSQGIISARGRYEQELEIDGVEHQEFLQTDAAINPGNSGGPLVNMKGEVIGLNTAIASEGGGSEGVGFSIPINLAKWVMTQLVAGGKVSRGAIGVNLQELSATKATELGLDRPRGARVAIVHEASPAFESGLRVGDVVQTFNGVEVRDDNHLISLVSVAPIGRSSVMVVWRDKKTLALRVTIADRDAVMARSAPRRPQVEPAIKPLLTLSPIDQATRLKLFARDDAGAAKGYLIATILPASPLARYFRVGDAIEAIDGKPIESAESAVLALSRASATKPVEVRFRRFANGGVTRKTVRVP